MMADKVYSPRRTADQWRSIVDQQSKSGLTSAAFCKKEGITYQSFMNWRKKLSIGAAAVDPELEPRFVELTESTDHQILHQSHWQIELDLAPGVQLRIAR